MNNKIKLKVFIAGKLVGDYHELCKKFQKVEDLLTKSGFDVLNPTKIIPKNVLCANLSRGESWEGAMEIIKPHLISSHVALFMHDWIEMCGAQTERMIAKRNDVRVVDWVNFPVELAEAEAEINKQHYETGECSTKH